MSKTDGHGIAGLLDRLLTANNARPLQPSATQVPIRCPQPERVTSHTAHAPSANTRRGRPPGTVYAPRPHKEKVTLRITASLVARYRDWSWEARSQLSQLVERALLDYHDRERIDPDSRL